MQDGPLVLDRCPFENVLSCVGHRLLRNFGRVDFLRTTVAEGVRYHPICLVTVLRGEFPVPVEHLFRRLNLFGIPCPVSRHLGGSGTLAADLL